MLRKIINRHKTAKLIRKRETEKETGTKGISRKERLL